MRFTIEHLSKNYESKQVLRDIDFTFEAGKIYGLLGRNGAGKTTLFNCIMGISGLTAGTSISAGHRPGSPRAGSRRKQGCPGKSRRGQKGTGKSRRGQNGAGQSLRISGMCFPRLRCRSF